MLSQVIRDSDISKELDSEGRQIKAEFIQAKQDEFTKQIELLKKQAESATQTADQSVNALVAYNNSQANLKADIDSLKEEVEKYRAQMALEKKGDKKKGIKAGKGSRYLAAKSNWEESKNLLATKQDEYNNRKPPSTESTAASAVQFNQQITELSTAFNAQKAAMEAMDLAVFAETYKHKLPKQFPKNTPGNRINALKKLNEQEAVPHWQSTEGMAQALLGVLFLSLLALKCFEPDEVRLYFNENLQEAWQRFNDKTLEQQPGGELFKNIPKTTYAEFVKLYSQYEPNTEHFIKSHFENAIAELKAKHIVEQTRAEKLAAELEYQKAKLKDERELARKLEEQRIESQRLKDEEGLQALRDEREQQHKRYENELAKLNVELNAQKEHLAFEQNSFPVRLDLLKKQTDAEIKEKEAKIKELYQNLAIQQKEAEQELAKKISETDNETKRIGYEHTEHMVKLSQEKENKEREIQLEEKRLANEHEEHLQAIQKENEMRQMRLEKDELLESVKLKAITEDLEKERAEKELLAKFEIDKIKRATSIETIQQIVKGIEISKETINTAIKNCELELVKCENEMRSLKKNDENAKLEPMIRREKISYLKSEIARNEILLAKTTTQEAIDIIEATKRKHEKDLISLVEQDVQDRTSDTNKSDIQIKLEDLEKTNIHLKSEKLNLQVKLSKEESKLDEWQEKLKQLIEW